MRNFTLRRLLGSHREHTEQLTVAFCMLAVTYIYMTLTKHFIPEYAFNVYEFIGTWSGLVCVWLCRTQNILCWPWGIVSAISLGFFFGDIALPGQQWLNWGYFLTIQLWAWPHWAFGGSNRTELPVTTLSRKEWIMTLSVMALGTFAVYSLIDMLVPGSTRPWLDALVVASSITAQYLLGQKKIENWILWLGPVNLVSIILFFSAGAYTLTALYVAFFIHAAFALRTWAKASK
jgi:nicotinamide mononucleotide transporter